MAERVPFFTLFESFQAPRQLRLLLHDACIISGALDMAGRTLEVQVESSETLPQAAQDALQQMLAQQYDLRQAEHHGSVLRGHPEITARLLRQYFVAAACRTQSTPTLPRRASAKNLSR